MKTNINTVLEEKYVRQINEFIKSKNITKREFFDIVLDDFIKNRLSSPFKLQFNEFDRLSTKNFVVSIFDDSLKKLENLNKKLNLNRRMLVREIFIVYFN